MEGVTIQTCWREMMTWYVWRGPHHQFSTSEGGEPRLATCMRKNGGPNAVVMVMHKRGKAWMMQPKLVTHSCKAKQGPLMRRHAKNSVVAFESIRFWEHDLQDPSTYWSDPWLPHFLSPATPKKNPSRQDEGPSRRACQRPLLGTDLTQSVGCIQMVVSQKAQAGSFFNSILQAPCWVAEMFWLGMLWEKFRGLFYPKLLHWQSDTSYLTWDTFTFCGFMITVGEELLWLMAIEIQPKLLWCGRPSVLKFQVPGCPIWVLVLWSDIRFLDLVIRGFGCLLLK